jgi:hypothetical protein
LANGTSNINIATANGNVTVTANATTWTFGSNSKITLPNGASLNDTSGDSVAFGQNAGLTSQAQHAVAIGINAGRLYQGEDSVAIGYNAGYYDQQRGVAIGWDAGEGGILFKSVSDAQGGSGPVHNYVSGNGNPTLTLDSVTNVTANDRVFGNNIPAGAYVVSIADPDINISAPPTAALTAGDAITFVGVVIGLNNATNVVVGMRATGTDIPANTFVQSTGCSVVTLNQYPTAPLTDGASIVFTVGQGFGATAIGYQAGSSFQDDNAVAVGRQAGYSNQGANAVAVGGLAGYNTQSINAVAVGYKAGQNTQGARAVAIGEDAGFQTQGEDAVAVGQKAGFQSQGRWAVAIGNSAGRSGQSDKAVAIGYGTGAVSQQDWAVAIGANAASYNQGYDAVAIGELAGNTSQGTNSVAVGYLSGFYNQLPAAVAVGYAAGQNFQGTQAVAIGDSAGAAGTTFGILYQSGSGTAITISPSADIKIGQRITGEFVPDDTFVVNIDPTGEFLDLSQAITGTPDPGTQWTAWQPQGIAAVAIGYAAGQNLQGNSAVAVGDHSGYQDQGINAVAVGYNAGYDTQGAGAVAIGEDAGFLAQGEGAVAIGFDAGGNAQGILSVAIGTLAGNNSQGNAAVAVGYNAGITAQGNAAVAIGTGAGRTSQGDRAVAIGDAAGYDTQGVNSVVIGSQAGESATGNNSIIINATGNTLNQTTANTFTVAPVRNDVANIAEIVFYNATSKEITYGNVISVAGNITGGNINTGGKILGNYIFAQSGATSAYATKRVLQYVEGTGVVTYSNYIDASSIYITGYAIEIHVSPSALDDSGNGTIGTPVKTIARAQVLAAEAFETSAAGQRKTIVLHPGDYVENVTISTQFTVLTTHELVGKNTTLSGTLTITKGCTIDGLKMTNLVISADNTTGSVDIIGCTVTTAVTKTSSAYTNFRGCDISSATLSITGTGSTVLVGGNYFTLAVNNAAAGVLAKSVVSMGPVTLTAGTLQLADTLIYAAANTGNAITQSAGSVITVNNCQTLIPNLTNVARNSFGGFYSILNAVYDKANSTFAGTSLSSILYSQNINADALTLAATTLSTSTATGALIVAGGAGIGGNVYVGNNITGGNVLTGGLISATGNVTANNGMFTTIVNTASFTGGLVSVTGNVTANNGMFTNIVNVASHTGAVVSVSGNVTGGNILTGGLISATGNITGGNLAIVGNTATITSANISIGYLNIPQVSLAANVTTALTDSGKHYYSTSASNLVLTIANNTSVVWPVGTAISLVNQGTGNITVAQGSGVSLYLAGNATAGNRTVTTYGMATLLNVAANIWMINGTGVS